jgi:hypothetical protein
MHGRATRHRRKAKSRKEDKLMLKYSGKMLTIAKYSIYY